MNVPTLPKRAPLIAAMVAIGIAVAVAIVMPEDDHPQASTQPTIRTATTTATSTSSAATPSPEPPVRLAAIPLRTKPVRAVAVTEAPPQVTASGTAYNPNLKIMWSFSSMPQTFDCVRAGVRVPCATFKCADLRGREAPCVDGGLHVAPFADVSAGDVARFTMLCGDPARVCASSNVTLSRGPLDDFRVVAVMHETLLVYPVTAHMSRSSWHRTGAIPEWEKRIDAGALALLGRANEQVGVRAWRPEDAIVLDEAETRRKRRAVR